MFLCPQHNPFCLCLLLLYSDNHEEQSLLLFSRTIECISVFMLWSPLFVCLFVCWVLCCSMQVSCPNLWDLFRDFILIERAAHLPFASMKCFTYRFFFSFLIPQWNWGIEDDWISICARPLFELMITGIGCTNYSNSASDLNGNLRLGGKLSFHMNCKEMVLRISASKYIFTPLYHRTEWK